MPTTCRSLRSSERRTAKIYPNGYGSRGPLFLVQHRLPDVFQTDSQLAEDWRRPERYYLVADHLQMARFEKLMGAENANVVISSGGKIALTNHPFAGTQLPRAGSLGGSRGEEEFRPEGLELSACLINSDAILKAANDRQPKYGTGIESEFIPFRELGVCGDGNSDVGWPANAQSGEPLSCDTDNREGVAFDANLFPDYVERTAKATLPELVAKH